MSDAPTVRTWLTDRFDLAVPVVCAPMAGPGGGRLAAAVSAAGALGMIGVGPAATPTWIAEQCAIVQAADKPFGVGLLAWALAEHPAQLDAVIASRPALVSVSFGPYERFVERLQQAGSLVATQVGNLSEARAAERAGVDLIVARGGEGGGHGRNDVATLPLLQIVLEAVESPVLAAGGVATGRGLAAVLAAGAAGGWAGTAFLACTEAATSPGARDRLFAATDLDTVYGRVFDIAQRLAWPTPAYPLRWAGAAQPILRSLGRRRGDPTDRRRGITTARDRPQTARLRHRLCLCRPRRRPARPSACSRGRRQGLRRRHRARAPPDNDGTSPGVKVFTDRGSVSFIPSAPSVGPVGQCSTALTSASAVRGLAISRSLATTT